MRFKRLAAVAVLGCLLATGSRATAQRLVLPAKVPVGEKVIAEFAYPVPEGGKLNLLWTPSPGLQTEQLGQRLAIWGRPGRHSVDLVVIPQKTITISDQSFDVIAGPITRYQETFEITGGIEPVPPIPPGPDPPVPPGPDTPPFPAPGFAVLMLYESQETNNLPPEQRAIFTSPQVLQYLNSKCVRLSEDGKPAVRLWDKDLTDSQLQYVPSVLKTAYRDVLGKAAGRLPWVAISTGTGGWQGPLPGNVNDMLTLLRKYGG